MRRRPECRRRGPVTRSSGEGTLRLWNVASHREIGPLLTGHTDWGLLGGVQPRRQILASGGGDRSVRLWEVASHRPVGSPLTGPPDDVYAVAFSPDGTTLASGSDDKSVGLWNVPQVGGPAVLLCKSVGQSLTRDQWQSIVPPGPKHRPLCP
jgi:WD40 repeat protein